MFRNLLFLVVAKQTDPATPTDSPNMKLQLSIDKPEIILVEDPMKSETNALVLDVSLVSKLR